MAVAGFRQKPPIDGTVYGVALNVRAHVASLDQAFHRAPYLAPPKSPILFIKPRNTFLSHGGVVPLPPELEEVEASAALALVFAQDTRAVSAEDALKAIAGCTLALDIAEPGGDYFRPPIREKCRDGFLPIGPSIVAREEIGDLDEITVQLEIDGKAVASVRTGDGIVSVAKLIEEISSFMTFRAGDVLLAALTPPGPRARLGSRISATARGLGRLECVLGREAGELP